MMFLQFGALFFDCLLMLFQLLAHLHKRVLCGIGFLSAFLGKAEIGFFQSVFLILTTISCVVHSICAPMLLAEVAMLLGASFLGDSGRRLSTRSLVSFLALIEGFLVGSCVGLFLCTKHSIALRDISSKCMLTGVISF
jgi:hypothetical protein